MLPILGTLFQKLLAPITYSQKNINENMINSESN